MKEFGAFLPLSRSAIHALQGNQQQAEEIVKQFVLLCDPEATDIKVYFAIWDEQDAGGNQMARRQFGLPIGTCGTVGWRCYTTSLGGRSS